MQYGMPAIGDLFRGRTQDIQETVNSVYYMLKQRINDMEAKNDQRQKVQKAEGLANELKRDISRHENNVEKSKKEVQNLKNKIKDMETKHKDEKDKVIAERDEFIKTISKIEHKEG